MTKRDQTRALEAVSKATAARLSATERWRGSIIAALDTGLTLREVAEHAGVTHARVAQINGEERSVVVRRLDSRSSGR